MMSLINDPGATSSPLCVVYLTTILSLRYVRFFFLLALFSFYLIFLQLHFMCVIRQKVHVPPATLLPAQQ